MNSRLIISGFLSFMLVTLSAQAEDLSGLHMPEFETMPGMKVEWVAEKMIYNGHPMTIRNFSSNRNADGVMKHYASRWKVQGHGELKYSRVGEDLTIGYVHNGYSYSVQARDEPGGSKGSLVVTRNKEFKQRAVKFPVHPDAHMLSRIHSIDMGSRSETLTLSTYHPVSIHRQWYRATLSRKGWQAQDTMPSSGQTVLAYQKGKSLCQLTFIDKSPVPNHRSMVMIHWIKG